MRRRSSIRPKRKGTAAVEAALMLPFLVLIVLGVCEMAWYVHCAEMLNNSARQAARTAVYHENSNAEVTLAARASLKDAMGLTDEQISVRISKLDSNGNESYQVQNLSENEQGEAIRISVSVNYGDVGLVTNLLGLKTHTLSSYAVMRRKK